MGERAAGKIKITNQFIDIKGTAYEKNKEISDCRSRRVWRNCI